MGQITIFDQYIKELEVLINKQRQFACESVYKNFEDYRDGCGYLRGLQQSYDLLVKIEKEVRGKD